MAYTWKMGGDGGGGYAPTGAIDSQNSGYAALGGDQWGICYTANYGDEWIPCMNGANVNQPPYGRAIAFAKRPGNAGRIYWGYGLMQGGAGGFAYTEKDSAVFNNIAGGDHFDSPLTGGNGFYPRAVGDLIQTDYDGSSTEYIYIVPPAGLIRYTCSGTGAPGSRTALWAPAGGPYLKSACLVNSTTLIVSEYNKLANGSANASPSTYLFQGSLRTVGSITPTVLTGAPNNVHDIRAIGGNVVAACGDGVYVAHTVSTSFDTWTKVSGTNMNNPSSSIVGTLDGYMSGSTLVVFAGQGDTSNTIPAGQSIAKLTCNTAGAGGAGSAANWTFVGWTTNTANVSTNQWGQQWGASNVPWWLPASPTNFFEVPGQKSMDVSVLRFDPNDPTHVQIWGRGGSWSCRNATDALGSILWRPAMIGCNGSTDNGISISGSTITVSNADWGSNVSTDGFQTTTRGGNVALGSPSSTTVNVAGQGSTTFAYSTANSPGDITMKIGAGSAVSIANSYFQGAFRKPQGIVADSSGRVVIAMVGGVLVGVPGALPTPPTSPGAISFTPASPSAVASVKTTWGASTGSDGAISYQIDRGDGNGFVTPSSGAGGLTDTHTYPNGTYSIHVQATDSNGTSGPTTASLTVAVPITAPTITAPASDGQTFPGPSLTLTWSDAGAGITGYETSLDGAAFVDRALTTSLSVTPGNGLHSFQVRAYDASGNRSTATTRTFTIGAAGLLAASIGSPVAGDVVPNPSVTTVFSAASGGTAPYAYTISYDGGTTFQAVSDPTHFQDVHTYPLGSNSIVLKTTDSGSPAQSGTSAVTFRVNLTIAAGGSHTVTVTYRPQVGDLLGSTESGNLVVTDNSGNIANSTQQVTFFGTVANLPSAVFNFTPGIPIDFGTAAAGSITDTQSLFLTNTGGQNLVVTGIALTGADAAKYNIDSLGGVLPLTIGAGSSITTTISFRPGVSDVGGSVFNNASLVYTDNDQGVVGSTQTFPLTGTVQSTVAQGDQPTWDAQAISVLQANPSWLVDGFVHTGIIDYDNIADPTAGSNDVTYYKNSLAPTLNNAPITSADWKPWGTAWHAIAISTPTSTLQGRMRRRIVERPAGRGIVSGTETYIPSVAQGFRSGFEDITYGDWTTHIGSSAAIATLNPHAGLEALHTVKNGSETSYVSKTVTALNAYYGRMYFRPEAFVDAEAILASMGVVGSGGEAQIRWGVATGSTSTSPATTTPGFYSSTWNNLANNHDGRVDDICEAHGVVYVFHASDHVIDSANAGADLTNVPFLTAYRKDTGAVIQTWAPAPNGRCYGGYVSADRTKLYVAGTYTTICGQTRHRFAAINLLTGPTDTTAATVQAVMPDLGVTIGNDGYDILLDEPNNRGWIAGQFTGFIKRIDLFNGAWRISSGWNPPTWVQGSGTAAPLLRAMCLKPDGTKLVVGGLDISPSLACLDPNTGASLGWTYQPQTAPGIFEIVTDGTAVYLGGGDDSGDMLFVTDWTGGGPNSLTHANGTDAGYWFHRCDGNVQAVQLMQINGKACLVYGHHGNNCASVKNSTTLNTTANGIVVLTAGTAAGVLQSYGHPPDFYNPNDGGGNPTGSPLKIFALLQDSAGDLHTGGDFTSINNNAAGAGNSFRRYGRFVTSNTSPLNAQVNGTGNSTATAVSSTITNITSGMMGKYLRVEWFYDMTSGASGKLTVWVYSSAGTLIASNSGSPLTQSASYTQDTINAARFGCFNPAPTQGEWFIDDVGTNTQAQGQIGA